MGDKVVYIPRHELHATTFGPVPDPLPVPVFPGTVAALFLSAA
jgi:hypothetical protein